MAQLTEKATIARKSLTVKKKKRIPARISICANCNNSFDDFSKEPSKHCCIECRLESTRNFVDCASCKALVKVTPSRIKVNKGVGIFCNAACFNKFQCKPETSSDRGSQWTSIRNKVINLFPFCALCGTTKKLQVHHIIPYRLTKDNSASNLIPLCTKHHKFVEMQFIAMEAVEDNLDRASIAWRAMLRGHQIKTLAVIRKILNGAYG
jgi:hypothetical protein